MSVISVAQSKGHVVYRLYNAEGALLYVGQTCDVIMRLRNHRHIQPWWDEVARVETTPVATREAGVERERLAIRTELPRYNVQLLPGVRKVVVNFRVPETVKQAAVERAEREGINLTDALRDFLTQWAQDSRD